MNDKELLELAAKAAGIEVISDAGEKGLWIKHKFLAWNPLTDDADALRLAVKLKIEIKYQAPDYRPNWTINTHVRGSDIYASESGSDPYAATHRAIVRAAAEIGRGME